MLVLLSIEQSGRRHFFVPMDGRGFVALPDDLEAGMATLAAEMARFGRDREAPVREVMARLGDRWSTLVLIVLAMGEWRHAALRRALARLSSEQAISQRVLTLKLRSLERDGFVLRKATDHVPPRVSYALTPLGQELAAQARGLIDWVNGRSAVIRAAREAFDRRADDRPGWYD